MKPKTNLTIYEEITDPALRAMFYNIIKELNAVNDRLNVLQHRYNLHEKAVWQYLHDLKEDET